MSKTIKAITSQAATTYATDNIIPVLEALATLDASTQTQNKLLAYHVFETSLLAGDEKINHAMIEKSINRTFDKRVTNKGLKVATYVKDAKPAANGVIYTAEQFQGDNPELHVMTVYGHIAAYETEQRKTKTDTKSVVEQALAASGLPIELADKQIKLAQDGNDAAMSFVKNASEKFTPAQKVSASGSETQATPQDTLTAALDVLIDMVTNGDATQAHQWIEQAGELIGTWTVTEQETPIAQAA